MNGTVQDSRNNAPALKYNYVFILDLTIELVLLLPPRMRVMNSSPPAVFNPVREAQRFDSNRVIVGFESCERSLDSV